MLALSTTDSQQFAKLLGLLGFNFAGESDVAGLAARRFMRARGPISWQELLCPAVETLAVSRAPIRWRETVVACSRQLRSLRRSEWEFLRNLPGSDPIPVKQPVALDDIADRVPRRAAA